MSAINGLDAIRSFKQNLNVKPERWFAGEPFAKLDLRPRSIVMCAGPPGAAKTTFAMQVVYGVLENNPSLRCLFSCVELDPDELFAKVLARLAGVPLTAIMDAEMTVTQQKQVERVIEKHTAIWQRIEFKTEPYTIVSLGEEMTRTQSQLSVVDYLQRFEMGAQRNETGDERMRLKSMMSALRRIARKGAGFLVLSSVSRQKDSKGRSSYEGLNLASCAGGSDIEFGANDVYIVEKPDESIVRLACHKKRFANKLTSHINLRFDGPYQSFSALDPFVDIPLDGYCPTPSEGRK